MFLPRMIVLNFTGGISWKPKWDHHKIDKIEALSVSALGIQVQFHSQHQALISIYRSNCKVCNNRFIEKHTTPIDGGLTFHKEHNQEVVNV